jgi:hypothetical protein
VQFETYLAQRRKKKAEFARFKARNPYADTLAKDLNTHLVTVERWLNGSWLVNQQNMRAAMDFFDETFPGQYQPTAGKIIWRGQGTEIFDGTPRSYSYDQEAAEAFAAAMAVSSTSFVIKRKVCEVCADKAAFTRSLDISKLMQAYAYHKYSWEKEVVILNTLPKAPTGILYEVTVN